MIRKGFTLIEMLVATMVFMTGFVGVYSLFIAGVDYRHQADQLTDLSLANTSLISTFRLIMRDQWNPPSDFVGDGDPSGSGAEAAGKFFPHPDNPKIWYRVHTATDITGQDGPDSAGLRLEIYLINLGNIPPSLSFSEIRLRQHVDPVNDLLYLGDSSASPGTDAYRGSYGNAIEGENATNYLALDTGNGDRSNFILLRRNILYKSEAIILRR